MGMAVGQREGFENLYAKPEEIKRTARILNIVLLIATAPRRYQRKHLVERFEVSPRMIDKDLEVIRHGLKLPLMKDKSGYYFEHMPELPALKLGFAEALALLMAVQSARSVSGLGGPELASAIARLETLFPDEYVTILRQSAQPALLSAHQQRRQRMLTLLGRAQVERRKLQIRYTTASRNGEISERVIHPYSLIPYVRSWQVIAYCEKRHDIVVFKVDRILDAVLLEAHYEIPADFDPETYMGNAWGMIRSQSEAEEVVLRFAPDAGRWVSEEQWHKSQRVETLADGSVLFTVQVPITPEFINWILYYGAKVSILKPEHLRTQIAEEHRRAAQHHERKE